jgi:hypothetical protein
MIKKILAGFAVAAGLVLVTPADKAAAVSLIGPGSALGARHVSESLVTEVRWGGRRGFHRGHFRGHGGWRPRRAWHRRYWAPPAYYYAAPRRCRVVWTYDGPRRVCRYRYW